MMDDGWDPEDNGPSLRFVVTLVTLLLVAIFAGIVAQLCGWRLLALAVTAGTFVVLCAGWALLHRWAGSRG